MSYRSKKIAQSHSERFILRFHSNIKLAHLWQANKLKKTRTNLHKFCVISFPILHTLNPTLYSNDLALKYTNNAKRNLACETNLHKTETKKKTLKQMSKTLWFIGISIEAKKHAKIKHQITRAEYKMCILYAIFPPNHHHWSCERLCVH